MGARRARAQHACALLADGSVKCWGFGFAGALGLGDRFNRGDLPRQMGVHLPTVDLGGPAVAVSAGQTHPCAILDVGSVKCWGWGQHGALGSAYTEEYLTSYYDEYYGT